MAEVSAEEMDAVWARQSDELIVSSAQSGMVDAVREAERRGLDVPEVYVAAIDNLPVEVLAADAEAFGDSWDEDSPKGEIPMTVLEHMAADGDAEAGAELHKRYPDWYDESGHLTPEGEKNL